VAKTAVRARTRAETLTLAAAPGLLVVADGANEVSVAVETLVVEIELFKLEEDELGEVMFSNKMWGALV
jgi:hypothetical protein